MMNDNVKATEMKEVESMDYQLDSNNSNEFTEFYRDQMTLLRDLEVINPQNLIKPLYQYLSILVSSDAEDLVGDIASHIEKDFSWINQAKQICSLPQAILDTEAKTQSYKSGDYRKQLVDDSLNQLKFYQQRYETDVLEEIAQLYHAVVTCCDLEELKRHKIEIVSYLEERNAAPLRRSPAEATTRLLQSALVHVIQFRTQQLKKIGIQFELTGNKFNRFVENFLANTVLNNDRFFEFKGALMASTEVAHVLEIEAKLKADAKTDIAQMQQQMLQFDVFSSVCHSYVLRFKQFKTEVSALLSEAVAERLSVKMAAVDTAIKAVNPEMVASNVNRLALWEKHYNELLELVPARQQELVVMQKEKESALNQQYFAELESAIKHAQTLVTTSSDLLVEVKTKLSCAVLAKECFRGFSLSAMFKYIKKKLHILSDELAHVSMALTRDIDWDMLDFAESKLSVIQTQRHYLAGQIRSQLDLTNDYLDTIQVDEEQYARAVASKWQLNLSKSLLKANKTTLEHYYEQLLRIQRVGSPYVRALFVIFFDRVQEKLSDYMVDQIQSWRIRNVSEETVIKTMRYFSIAISDDTLLRIAPHLKYYREALSPNNGGSFAARCGELVGNMFGVLSLSRKTS